MVWALGVLPEMLFIVEAHLADDLPPAHLALNVNDPKQIDGSGGDFGGSFGG